MSEFKLSKSIRLITGIEIDTLNLDYDALTMADLKTANKIAHMIADGATVSADNISQRLDPNLRIGIAWAAAIKGTHHLAINDILQVSLTDTLLLSEDAALNYLFR